MSWGKRSRSPLTQLLPTLKTHSNLLIRRTGGTVSRADSALHIAINIMGTLLLGASNYTMQCISSPTRGEIDKAHSKGRYLDIGLPSLRNLEGWRKKILFWLLVGSTMPLHFLYVAFPYHLF
jgi:hypothetical protein